MKKTIIVSAILLFAQMTIIAKTTTTQPVSSVETPKNDKIKDRDQRDGNQDKQPKMSAADRAVQYSNELKKTLALTPSQYQKVLAVNTECIIRKDANRDSGDKGTMKTGKADIKAYRVGEFKKIFTAQQMTTYQQMNANMNVKDDNEKDDIEKGNIRGQRGKGIKLEKDEGKGIQFFKGTLKEALAKAKSENKMVMMDCYTTWCGPCKILKKQVFVDKTLGDYMNEKYVCVAIDYENGEGPAVDKLYPVDAYPTLYFLDASGKVKKTFRGVPEENPAGAILSMAKKFGK